MRDSRQPPAATRLVCTIGPASAGAIGALIDAGMDVARLNLSHGRPEDHAAAIAAVRAEAGRRGRVVAVLADLPGPKVRLGQIAGGATELRAGTAFQLRSAADAEGDATGAGTSHAGLAADLHPGDLVLLADGAVELRVVASQEGAVRTTVERGGTVRSGAGVSVPAARLSLPSIGARDRELAAFAVRIGVDFVGQSFVREADDVRTLRDLLGPGGPGVVAKIETRPAAERAEAIIDAADAVMVARGDLGVELPFEEVPLVQRHLIAACLAAGRPVIVATQMLESMTSSPRPTRAEVSDVANAVLDGADAVMLSAETAIGAHPVLAAEAAVRIARAAERERTPHAPLERLEAPGVRADPALRDATAIGLAAAAIADAEADVAAIVTWTRSGWTARALAARRPPVPIIAITPDPAVARALVLHRGVEPEASTASPDDAIRAAVARLRAAGRTPAGAAVVVLAAEPAGAPGPRSVEILRVEE